MISTCRGTSCSGVERGLALACGRGCASNWSQSRLSTCASQVVELQARRALRGQSSGSGTGENSFKPNLAKCAIIERVGNLDRRRRSGHMRRSRVAAALGLCVVLAIVTLAACNSGATCDGDGFDLTFTPVTNATYVVQLDIPGDSVSCTFSAGQCCPCTGKGVESAQFSAPPSSLMTLRMVNVGTPSDVKLSVSRDGSLLYQAIAHPHYISSNDCGSDQWANVVVTLPQ